MENIDEAVTCALFYFQDLQRTKTMCVRSYNLYNQGALASSTATSTAVKTSLLKLIHVF